MKLFAQKNYNGKVICQGIYKVIYHVEHFLNRCTIELVITSLVEALWQISINRVFDTFKQLYLYASIQVCNISLFTKST